jgi:xylulokinase
MSVMLNAAVCVDWAAKLTGHADARSLLARVETSKNASSDGVVFLPYLGGERTPHNDPRAKGVFFGLTHGTDTDALAIAVLEGVAFAFADGLDALIAAGSKVDSLTVVGGGAQSPLWGRILASVLGRPLIYRKNADVGPAQGAARLAQIAVTGRGAEQVCVPPEIVRVAEPDDRLAEGLASRRKTFRALYQRLKDLVPETPS